LGIGPSQSDEGLIRHERVIERLVDGPLHPPREPGKRPADRTTVTTIDAGDPESPTVIASDPIVRMGWLERVSGGVNLDDLVVRLPLPLVSPPPLRTYRPLETGPNRRKIQSDIRSR
jgi:hypothetical protein